VLVSSLRRFSRAETTSCDNAVSLSGQEIGPSV
jgi:hypothetical protein